MKLKSFLTGIVISFQTLAPAMTSLLYAYESRTILAEARSWLRRGGRHAVVAATNLFTLHQLFNLYSENYVLLDQFVIYRYYIFLI